MAAVDGFMANHGVLPDIVLLERPEAVMHAQTFFLCTCKAELVTPPQAAPPQALKKEEASPHAFMALEAMTNILISNPHGCLVAILSNTGYSSQPGYEHLVAEANARHHEQRYLAAPDDEALAANAKGAREAVPKKGKKRVVVKAQVPTRIGKRKKVGLGVCFHSAIHFMVKLPGGAGPEPAPLEAPGAAKIYQVKYFPTTGQMQVSGGIRPDLSDVTSIIELTVDYINEELKKVMENPPEGPILVIKPGSLFPNMMNFKSSIWRTSPRIGLKHVNVVQYFQTLENHPVIVEYFGRLAEFEKNQEQGVPPSVPEDFEAPAGMIVVPPWRVSATSPQGEDIKISFNFNGIKSPRGTERKPLVNIFSKEGKFNLLGLDTFESAETIHAYFQKVLSLNWSRLVRIIPRPD